MAGDTLGHYRILRPLGSGGMGEVFLAHDTTLDRHVALKRLPDALAHQPERRARFEREAKAVAALDHPNIVTVFSVEEADGVPFFTMQYVEGRTLREAIPPRGFALPDLLTIAIPLADAVAAAHGRGILHRDLKPANVMLTPESRVKVLDFGLAKVRDDSSPDAFTRTATELTRDGHVVGTVAYMSPEQAEGKPVDARSDVFALGVVLYELATGQRPFPGDTSASVIAAILRDTPPAVTTLRPELPPDVARIVTRALQKDPERRYQTAKDLRNDLEGVKAEFDAGRLASGAAAVAHEAAPAPADGRAWWMRRAWLGLAAVVLVVAAGIGVWRWTRTPPAAPVPTTPTLDPKRVAVAIFENRTGDVSLDPLGLLAAERIAEGLPQIGTVQVVPTAAVADLARHDPSRVTATSRDPVQRLAAATGAGLVVTGALHLEGNDLRLRARLTDATTGTFVLIEPEPAPRAAPMAAIDETRDRVMGAVAVKLDPASTVMMVGTAPKHQAYQEWVAAGEVDNAEVIKHLRRALDLDPTFTAARLNLLGTYDDPGEDARQFEIIEQQRERMSPAQQQWLASLRAELAGRNEEAYRAARTAASLVPPSTALNLALAGRAAAAGHFRAAVEALSAPLDWQRGLDRGQRGTYVFFLASSLHWLGEHERELVEVRRGRAQLPDVVVLRWSEGQALAALGRLDEVDRVVTEGLSMAGPHDTMMIEIAMELRAHGHLQACTALARRYEQWYANLPPEEQKKPRRLQYRGVALRLLERLDEARAVFEQLARAVPDNPQPLGNAGVLAARLGDRARAQRIFDELGRTSDDAHHRGWRAYLRAGIAAHLGDKDRAVELLRLNFAQGGPYDIHVHHELDFEPLRGYPPFEALMKPKD